MIRAIIYKEFRENLRWAVAILLILLVLMLNFWDHRSRGQSLAADWFLAMTVVAYAVLGLKMARFPRFRDVDPGRWQLLRHRPIPPTRMFLAHVATGVGMFLIVGAIPLAAAVWWAATPGSIPGPFDWHMVLPPLSDLLAGLMWYFAALIVVTRPARWFGSKLLPFGLPLMAQIEMYSAPTFGKAMVLLAIALAILAAGASGSYCTPSRSYEREPRGAKVALATSLMLGATLLLAAVTTVALTGFRLMSQGPYVYECYQIDRSGRILRVTYKDGVLVRCADLDGTPTPAERNPTFASMDLVPELTQADLPRLNFHAARHNISQFDDFGRINWFWVAPQRVVEGYEVETRRYVGAFGPDGFVVAPARPTPFPEGARPSGLNGFVIDSHHAWELFFDDRTIRQLVGVEGDEQVIAANAFGQPKSAEDEWFRVVATTRKLYVFPRGRPKFAVPLDTSRWWSYTVDVDAIGTNAAAATAEMKQTSSPSPRIILTFKPSPFFHRRADEAPVHVAEYALDGKPLREMDLPILHDSDAHWVHSYQKTLAVSMPLATFEVANLAARFLHGSIIAKVREHDQAWIPSVIVPMLLVGGLCALVTWWWTRRYGLPLRRRIGWAAGNLVLGMPGVLTLLSLPEWPPRVSCPSCRRARVVNRDHCEHCGATFPRPPENDTEIFD